MIMKDEYGYWKDFAEVFLIMALIISLLMDIQVKFLAADSLLFFLFTIQLPFSIKVASRQKDVRYLIFSLGTLVRAFARVIGGGVGVIRFCIIGR